MRFILIRDEGESISVWDRLGLSCDTRVCAGAQRWSHWGGSGALDLCCSSSSTASPLIRWPDKVGNERRLREKLD